MHALKSEAHIKVYSFLKPVMSQLICFFCPAQPLGSILALIFESFKQLAICMVDFEDFDGKLVLKGEPLVTE